MTTATDVFVLHPDSEAAFWALVDHLFLPVTGSALTLVRQAVQRGGNLPEIRSGALA